MNAKAISIHNSISIFSPNRIRPILVYIILPLIALLSCSPSHDLNHSVKFVVLLERSASGQQVYLTGNKPQLGNWNPSVVPLTKNNDSDYSIILSFPSDESIEYKVTAGSWWTQALDKDESVYNNFRLKLKCDTVVSIHVYDWLNKMVNGRPVLTAERFHPKRPYLKLDGGWNYHPGDEPVWASPAYNDSGWQVTDPFIRWSTSSEPTWNGHGWFRFHLYADTSFWNRTLAIRIEQLGASQIFYNGRLLYSFGEISSSSTQYKPNSMSWWQEFKVDPQYDQLIAVRYENEDWKSLQGMEYTPGFLISLKDINTAFQTAVDVRRHAERQMLFTLIPLVLACIHFSLYGFLRKQRQNLYYAICMLGFAGLTFFSYVRNLVVDVGQIILYNKLGSFSVAIAILFGVLIVYELNYSKLPKRVWGFIGMFLIVNFLVLFNYPARLIIAVNYVFFGLTTLESIFSVFFRETKHLHGGWILLVGFLALTMFIALQILVDYAIIPQTIATSQMYAYGMLSLAISMSIFLSYNFARINKDLEVQLDTVQQLSDKAIEQERVAHSLALERKVIELESDRKSKELESARALQLSLLPKEVPRWKGLDIAATMMTATEVGGDYYDFFESENTTFMVVVGDATGHGLKAGNMVTATKGLLNMLSNQENVENILISANRAIKRMNLPMITMCLAVTRIRGNTLWYSSAGMPPLLVYRAKSGQCEPYVLKAMPLGAVEHFPYARTSLTLSNGDVVVMTSDGLHEVFDEKRDTYGIDNIMHSLQTHAGKSAEGIVRGLYEDGKAWGGNTLLADDLTIVVIKSTDNRF
jgi:serine phosphatase RsbU (regulator of sigma subunit)